MGLSASLYMKTVPFVKDQYIPSEPSTIVGVLLLSVLVAASSPLHSQYNQTSAIKNIVKKLTKKTR